MRKATIALAVIVLLVLVGCASQNQGSNNKAGASATSVSIDKTVQVEGTEFSFNPSTINVEKGQTVKVEFKNVGRVPHDFAIRGMSVKTQTIGSGQTDSVTFTAPESGTYTFYCSVPGHESRGMHGDLHIA